MELLATPTVTPSASLIFNCGTGPGSRHISIVTLNASHPSHGTLECPVRAKLSTEKSNSFGLMWDLMRPANHFLSTRNPFSDISKDCLSRLKEITGIGEAEISRCAQLAAVMRPSAFVLEQAAEVPCRRWRKTARCRPWRFLIQLDWWSGPMSCFSRITSWARSSITTAPGFRVSGNICAKRALRRVKTSHSISFCVTMLSRNFAGCKIFNCFD